MAINPDVTREVLDAYLGGTLPLPAAAERIAEMLEPSERLSFTIEIPVESAATREAKRLAELRTAVNLKGSLPHTPAAQHH